MKRSTVVGAFSSIFLIGHFGILISCIFANIVGGGLIKSDELWTTMGILVPLTSAYVTAIIKRIADGATQPRPQTAPEPYPAEFGILVIALSLGFVLYLAAIVTLKFLGTISDFEEFKKYLFFGETLFGAYVGLISSVLFGESTRSTQPSANTDIPRQPDAAGN